LAVSMQLTQSQLAEGSATLRKAADEG
jgi:hypothetical protein